MTHRRQSGIGATCMILDQERIVRPQRHHARACTNLHPLRPPARPQANDQRAAAGQRNDQRHGVTKAEDSQ
jgi:hypothetical protein